MICINETWKSDTFPESWREALIISIPKPIKDHFNPLNYRPIALTSCICKTVERMVNERLVWYLEKNGLLAKQQCGYRSNRSTVDHLVGLETFIRDAFIHNQHLVVRCDMAFIEPMHRNKPNIIYSLTSSLSSLTPCSSCRISSMTSLSIIRRMPCGSPLFIILWQYCSTMAKNIVHELTTVFIPPPPKNDIVVKNAKSCTKFKP